MATQTDLDRLHIAWAKLRAMLNTNTPNASARMAAVRSKALNTDNGHGK